MLNKYLVFDIIIDILQKIFLNILLKFYISVIWTESGKVGNGFIVAHSVVEVCRTFA